MAFKIPRVYLIMQMSCLSESKQEKYMSRNTTKPTKWYVRPAKTQISLGIRQV